MDKPQFLSGYSKGIAGQCERVLGTLLRGMGPWRESVYLIGGLVPRYIVRQRPPQVPAHAGTGDVDIVIDLQILANTEAYRTLEENLKRLNFERGVSRRTGAKVNYKWQRRADDALIEVEFLVDDPGQGERLQELPSAGDRISALNIPHSSMVFDFHESVKLTIELLDDGGIYEVTIRHADIVCFTVLKALAFAGRAEPKDAHDLVYCLEHCEGSVKAAAHTYAERLQSKHGDVMRHALNLLRVHFVASDGAPGHLKDGSVAVATFELEKAEADRERRMLRQRQVSDLVSRFVADVAVQEGARDD